MDERYDNAMDEILHAEQQIKDARARQLKRRETLFSTAWAQQHTRTRTKDGAYTHSTHTHTRTQTLRVSRKRSEFKLKSINQLKQATCVGICYPHH